MKRSTAVKKIIAFLRIIDSTHFSDDSGEVKYYRDISNKLLLFLENEIGMIPPYFEIEINKAKDKQKFFGWESE